MSQSLQYPSGLCMLKIDLMYYFYHFSKKNDLFLSIWMIWPYFLLQRVPVMDAHWSPGSYEPKNTNLSQLEPELEQFKVSANQNENLTIDDGC